MGIQAMSAHFVRQKQILYLQVLLLGCGRFDLQRVASTEGHRKFVEGSERMEHKEHAGIMHGFRGGELLRIPEDC